MPSHRPEGWPSDVLIVGRLLSLDSAGRTDPRNPACMFLEFLRKGSAFGRGPTVAQRSCSAMGGSEGRLLRSSRARSRHTRPTPSGGDRVLPGGSFTKKMLHRCRDTCWPAWRAWVSAKPQEEIGQVHEQNVIQEIMRLRAEVSAG